MSKQFIDITLTAGEQKFAQDFEASNGMMGNPVQIFRFPEPVDLPRLRSAMEAALNNHGATATVFYKNDKGETLKRIDPDYRATVEIEEMTDEEFDALRASIMCPQPLYNVPLVHLRLIHAPSGVYLIIDIHHIVVDGVAMTVLLDDMTKVYNGEPLPPEGWSIYDITRYEQEYLQSDEGRKAVERLEDMWANAEGIFPKGDVDGDKYDLDIAYFDIDVDFGQIRTATRCAQSVVTAAACNLLLAWYTGNRNAATVSTFVSRPLKEMERTLGMLSRYLVFTVPFTDDTTVADYLASVKEATMTPRRCTYANLEAMRRMGKDFINYMEFIYQGTILTWTCADQHLETVRIPYTNHYEPKPLNVHFLVRDGKPKLMFLWQRSRYSEAFIATFARRYTTVLNRMLTAATVGEVLAAVE